MGKKKEYKIIIFLGVLGILIISVLSMYLYVIYNAWEDQCEISRQAIEEKRKYIRYLQGNYE